MTRQLNVRWGMEMPGELVAYPHYAPGHCGYLAITRLHWWYPWLAALPGTGDAEHAKSCMQRKGFAETLADAQAQAINALAQCIAEHKEQKDEEAT